MPLTTSECADIWIKARKALDEAEQKLNESIQPELKAAIAAKDLDRLIAITNHLPKHSSTLRRVYEAIGRMESGTL